MAKELKELTSQDENYSQWYQDLVVKADLAENSAVRGCMPSILGTPLTSRRTASPSGDSPRSAIFSATAALRLVFPRISSSKALFKGSVIVGDFAFVFDDFWID